MLKTEKLYLMYLKEISDVGKFKNLKHSPGLHFLFQSLFELILDLITLSIKVCYNVFNVHNEYTCI